MNRQREMRKKEKFHSNEMGKMPAKNEVNIALVHGMAQKNNDEKESRPASKRNNKSVEYLCGYFLKVGNIEIHWNTFQASTI